MNIELRTDRIRQVREANKVPGVMYGSTFKSTSIQVDDKALKEALKTYGKNMTFKVKLEGKQHFAYIQHVETVMLKPHDIIHFDLRCVGAKESVFTTIPLVFIGKEAFHQSKLYPQEAMTEIHAEYLPGYGVSKIEVNVSKLKLGESIKVKDLVVEEHIHLKEDPEHAIVTIKEVHVKAEEEVVEAEESEIIVDEKKEIV